jgi:hypothetical protein
MDNLEKALNIFRNEVSSVAWSFYVWKGFNEVASSDVDIYGAINKNALSWNIITHSLQSNFFITLGRLFDLDGDAFSVHVLLKSCIKNIDQFSLNALRERKIRGNNGVVPDWIDDYMKSAYQPTVTDIQRLRGEVSKWQKIYAEIYRPIRHKVIAHRERDTIENVGELYGKTNIGQIQEFIDFLHQIEKIVFDLLHNGTLNEVGFYRFTEDERAHADIGALLERLKA